MGLILAALACWRLTSLLVYEDGPNEMLAYLRGALAEWTKVLDCFWCTSVWVAAPLAALAWWPEARMMALGWLAVSAGAIVIDELLPSREEE